MYRTDICVKQRNEQEGIELQIWCIQNNIPIDKCNFDFIDSWCYFSWRALVPGFCRNYEKGKNLQVVSIEDFKTLQLEAMGKQDQKYEVGKWYTHPKWYPNTYIKFSSIRDYNSVYELERISQGEYKGVSTNWSISYEHTLEEAKMEVVSQFLPDGHPDKISSNPEYVKLEKYWSIDDEYVGEIFELKTLNNLSKFKNAPSKENFIKDISDWIKKGFFTIATKEEWEKQNNFEPVKKEISKEENLVGRWVKRIAFDYYKEAHGLEIGEYDKITDLKSYGYHLQKFMACDVTALLADFEIMPEGFDPNKIVEPSLDFGSLNLEDWLRETKKLNLSQEELQNHIDYKDSCNPNVYKELKGNTLEEKTDILWNEWNLVTGVDYYVAHTRVLSPEEIVKPNTPIHKAQLIEVKTKQIFKN